jgi:phage terminase large subunit-like protein
VQRTRELAHEFYADVLSDAEQLGNSLAVMNHLGRRDLFFLLVRLMNRRDMDRDWLYERCREIQESPDGYLDLWAREHYKSTIITFGKSIQDILDSHSKDSFFWESGVTIGIFSHTRPVAKAFLFQIAHELKTNNLLKEVYPDVLYQNPEREAPKWSLDSGILVKRGNDSNKKESTVEAWGLVDGQPTGKHFDILVYDDVVTIASVTTTEQMKKTTDAWAISLNLGADGGVRRMIGTRYHYNDTYRDVMERGSAIPRKHPATVNGKARGKSVLVSDEVLAEKRRDMGVYVFSCQMLLEPKEDSAMGFSRQWLRYYDASLYQSRQKKWPSKWFYYLLCDPAGEKKKDNDYTCMAVLARGPDQNTYFVDGIRDRLNLSQRTKMLFLFHRKYPIKKTGYEKYGKDSDIEHIEYVQEQEEYRFTITPLGGPMPKNDRIRRLVPLFEYGRFFLPHQSLFIDEEGKTQDFVKTFIDEEYDPFPVAIHDDMLDNIARIEDPKFGAVYPKPLGADNVVREGKKPRSPLDSRGYKEMIGMRC